MTTGDVRAGIVVTGTELLTGLIADRNGPWLAERLGGLGVEVAHLLMVGDRPADLSSALRFLADQGVDLIVTSGGLGPTTPHLVIPGAPVVVVLPGPPRELQTMWPTALATAPVREVLDRTRPYDSVRLRLFGLPESEIAQTLRETDVSGLEIATCQLWSELEVDIRHRPPARPKREALVSEIARRHGSQLFSTDGSTVDDQVAALLAGRWIGVAESCTGGLLAGRLTARAGSSAYVAGGVVSYSNQAKIELLGVSAELIERHGAVSPEVARAMADGALRRFGADVGVGITGVAGPGGGTEAKPVGYVCLCTVIAGGAILARDPVLPGDRGDVREWSVSLAMHMLRRLLGG